MSDPSPDPRPSAVRTLARQGPPPGIYAPKFTPELGVLICARLAAGESLRSMCRADAAMPTEKTVWNWRRGRPEFAAAYAEALLGARAAALAEQAERDGRRRAEVMAGSRAPSGRVAWNRGRSGYSAQAAERICHGLGFGMSLQEVCREPGSPCVATVYNWLREHPEFLAQYRRAKAKGFYWVVHDAMETQAAWAGTYGGSMRLLNRVQKAALRRCAWLAPTRLANAIYGVEEPDPIGAVRRVDRNA